MLKRLKGISLSRLYLIIAIPIGLLMLFINPPFQVPDEGAHYFKSLTVAQGNFRCGEDIFAPSNYVNLSSDTQLVKIKNEEYKKVSGSKIKEALITSASQENSLVNSAVCNVFPLGYFPQALGLKIGLLTHAPPLVAFYLARLLVFAAAVFLIYKSITITPFGKIIFLLIGLLPMTMQQVASLSYDALHVGAILLFTAYVFRLISANQPLFRRQYWLTLALSIVAVNIKPGYFFLSGLIFLLSENTFQNKKQYWLHTIGFVVANILVFLVFRFIFNEAGVFPKDVNPNAQLLYVLKNPFNFLFLVVESLYKNWRFYYETFLLKPGWMNTGLNPLLYISMGMGIILLLRSHAEEIVLSARQRAILFGVFLMQFLFVFLSLYLVWTPVGDDKISGVQGRYLLAIFPLFVFSFYKSKFNFRSQWIKENMSAAILIFLAVVFFFVFLDMIGLYYKSLSAYF